MTIESPNQGGARRSSEVGDKTNDSTGTRSPESRLNLLAAASPQESLDHFSNMQRQQALKEMPAGFPKLEFGEKPRSPQDRPGSPGRPSAAAERYFANDPKEPPTPDTVRTEKTKITGTGSPVSTNVEIRYGESGQPHSIRDQHGEWTSTDGGKTWKTGEPKFAIRRGSASIDASGNYSFENSDYGLKSTFSPDGTSKRSITTSGGDTYSVTRDKKGAPVGFSDKSGDWTSPDGKNWTNSKTSEKKAGSVSLNEYGEFKFKSADGKGELQVAQSTQLERINQLKAELKDKYKITFAEPGEIEQDQVEQTIGGGMEPGRQPGAPRSADPVPRAGVPTEAELKTLGGILDKTRHVDYSGMKVWFMQHGDYNPSEMAVYKRQEGGPGGGPNGPGTPGHEHRGNCCGSRGVERKPNGDLVVNAPARQETSGYDTFERTGLHELSHHEQHSSLGKLTGEMVGKGSTPESRKLADEMGWELSKKTGRPVFRDKDGGRWARVQPDNAPPYWEHDSGTAPKDKRQRIDDFEMRERAEVKPPTFYNDTPHETHAESLAAFRIGEREQFRGGRRQLAEESPKLYDAIRRYDQQVIDKSFGKNENGESKMIRAIDGTLVENTPEARRAIEERERYWRWRSAK